MGIAARLLFVAFVLLCVHDAHAQLPHLAEASAQYMPASEVPESGGLRAQISSYDALFNVPMQLGARTVLIPGLQYHMDSVSYSQEPPGFIPLNALHGIDVTLLLAQRLSERFSLAFRAWPGLAGDLSRADSGALHVGGLAMFTWTPSTRFTLGGGALASYAFGQLLPLPMLYVDWKPQPIFRVEASLPFFASALFRFAERFEGGALADVGGNQYAIRKAEIRDSAACTGADRSSCLDHLSYSIVSAGAVARVRLISSLWLGAFLGHTLYRRYDLQNADAGSVPGGNIRLPNVPIFRLTLTFRIPVPESAQPEPAAH